MIETGETLKSTRESSGISLDEVSKDLDIPIIELEQIEAGSIGSFQDIYDLKRKLLAYSKYLGLNVDDVTKRFNEHMFDITSKIPMKEIEKKVRDIEKENEESDAIASPYTKSFPKEKTLPYILIGLLIFVVIVLAVLWSINQLVRNNVAREISYIELDRMCSL